MQLHSLDDREAKAGVAHFSPDAVAAYSGLYTMAVAQIQLMRDMILATGMWE